MKSILFQKRILITGVCGTIGKELLKQTIVMEPAQIIALDNNETELYLMAEEYSGNHYIEFFFTDIRNAESLFHHMHGIDVVFHAAALKHVIVCERAPRDAILTNILGIQNIIDTAIQKNVGRVIFTSSDKAVNPTNVMGTSKLMGERLFTAANALRPTQGPIFASTRFGNVLGSRGSVIPLFKKQIAKGGPVTITDPEMTRFIMTKQEAVGMVLDSVSLIRGGEVVVTKMPTIKIKDLAQVMVEELAPQFNFRPSDIEIKVIGPRQGEKFYEELMNEEEIRRAVELTNCFIIIPAFLPIRGDMAYEYQNTVSLKVSTPYNSSNQKPLNCEELRQYFQKNELI